MNFYVTVLGSGAATPTFARHCSAQIVNINGFRMLVDCGESTQNQMRYFHQKLQSFNTIFISHLHGDHIFGLPGLLSTMSLSGRTEPIDLIAPQGIKKALDLLFEVSGTHLQYELRYHELDHTGLQEVFANSRCRVTAFPLDHSVPTYGYCFEEVVNQRNIRKEIQRRYDIPPAECRLIKMGSDYTAPDGTYYTNDELTLPPKPSRRYAYCCDTGYTETIVPYIKQVDLLCMEATFGSEFADLANERQHCTSAQAALIAKQAEAGKLLMTHISARYKESDILLQEATEVFPNAEVAVDGGIYEVQWTDRKE